MLLVGPKIIFLMQNEVNFKFTGRLSNLIDLKAVNKVNQKEMFFYKINLHDLLWKFQLENLFWQFCQRLCRQRVNNNFLFLSFTDQSVLRTYLLGYCQRSNWAILWIKTPVKLSKQKDATLALNLALIWLNSVDLILISNQKYFLTQAVDIWDWMKSLLRVLLSETI